MPHISYMPKLLDVHQWGRYANIYATYKLISTNLVTRSTVHKWHRMTTMHSDHNDTTAWLHILTWPLDQISQKITLTNTHLKLFYYICDKNVEPTGRSLYYLKCKQRMHGTRDAGILKVLIINLVRVWIWNNSHISAFLHFANHCKICLNPINVQVCVVPAFQLIQ